jgi:hypothetical protein
VVDLDDGKFDTSQNKQNHFVGISESLERIARLKQSGVLTEEEFQVLKERLISEQQPFDPIEGGKGVTSSKVSSNKTGFEFKKAEEPVRHPQSGTHKDCKDCGEKFSTGFLLCPHCGSKTTELRRREKKAKANELAEKRKKDFELAAKKKAEEKKGCFVTILIILLFTGIVVAVAASGGSGGSNYDNYDERLARCYFSEERSGYDFAGDGSRDNTAMRVCLNRVKK